jgi:hypothetical protein
MSISRRGFLGSVAASCLGLVGACRANSIREWNRERIDKAQEKYGGPVTGSGFLDQPAFSHEHTFRPPQVPYCAQPGDIMFSVTNTRIYLAGHLLSGAGVISHSGIIFRRPDGCMAVCEAGPFDIPLIRSMDMVPYMSAYNNRGRVWVRTRCVPLTEEQSCRLTEFCEMQEDKPFAKVRLYRQVTPIRTRGPLRTFVIGQPHGPDRRGYFCSEMCTEAIIYVGLICPEDTRPSATYPTDLFYDESNNLFLNRHFKLGERGWSPPARWRPHPCNGGCADAEE